MSEERPLPGCPQSYSSSHCRCYQRTLLVHATGYPCAAVEHTLMLGAQCLLYRGRIVWVFDYIYRDARALSCPGEKDTYILCLLRYVQCLRYTCLSLCVSRHNIGVFSFFERTLSCMQFPCIICYKQCIRPLMLNYDMWLPVNARKPWAARQRAEAMYVTNTTVQAAARLSIRSGEGNISVLSPCT